MRSGGRPGRGLERQPPRRASNHPGSRCGSTTRGSPAPRLPRVRSAVRSLPVPPLRPPRPARGGAPRSRAAGARRDGSAADRGPPSRAVRERSRGSPGATRRAGARRAQPHAVGAPAAVVRSARRGPRAGRRTGAPAWCGTRPRALVEERATASRAVPVRCGRGPSRLASTVSSSTTRAAPFARSTDRYACDESTVPVPGLLQDARLDLAADVAGQHRHQRMDVADRARERERADHPAGVGLEDRRAGAGQVLEEIVVVLRAADQHRPALDEHRPDAVGADRLLGEVEPLGGAGPVHGDALAAEVGVARDDPAGRVGQHHRHGDVGEAVLEPVEHRLGRPTQRREGIVGLAVVDALRCGRARSHPRIAASSSRCTAARPCPRGAPQQPAPDQRLPAEPDALAFARRQGRQAVALVSTHRCLAFADAASRRHRRTRSLLRRGAVPQAFQNGTPAIVAPSSP